MSIVEHKGRFYIATWNDRAAQYHGPLTSVVRKKTGCSGFFCRSPDGLPGSGAYNYARRSDALRRIRLLENI